MNETANGKLISTVFILLLIVIAAAIFNQREHQPVPIDSSKVPALPQTLTKHIQPAKRTSITYAAALDEILLESDPRKREIAFGQLLSRWLDEDMEGALAYVRQLPQGPQYNEGLSLALEHIAKSDPTRAVILAGEMATTTEQRNIYSSLFSQMANHDLTNALSALSLTPTGEARDNAVRAIASTWSAKDMNAALDWAKNLTDPIERSAALETSLTALAKNDPKKAFLLAMDSLEGGALENVAAIGLKGMFKTDPDSVSKLILQLPAGDLQTGLTMDIARALTAQEPAIAIDWVQSLRAGELRQNALNNILDAWNAENSAEVAQFILQMPPGADQDAAVNHLSHTFGSENPEDAMRWAQSLPNESARNAAMVNIVSGWAESDPLAATVWAQNLPADSPLRTETLRGAYSYWTLSDPTAAANFSNSLSKADQAQLFGK